MHSYCEGLFAKICYRLLVAGFVSNRSLNFTFMISWLTITVYSTLLNLLATFLKKKACLLSQYVKQKALLRALGAVLLYCNEIWRDLTLLWSPLLWEGKMILTNSIKMAGRSTWAFFFLKTVPKEDPYKMLLLQTLSRVPVILFCKVFSFTNKLLSSRDTLM